MSEIKYLDRDEIIELSRVAEGMDRLILNLLLDTGMRVGELVATKVEDVNFDYGFIRLSAKRTKTKKFRTVRVSAPLIQKLKEYIKPGQVYLFPGYSNGHISVSTVQKRIAALAERVGIQQIEKRNKLNRRRVTPHTMRHTHIVNSLLAGISLPSVQKQVGHARLSSTEIYTNYAPTLVKAEYDAKFNLALVL